MGDYLNEYILQGKFNAFYYILNLLKQIAINWLVLTFPYIFVVDRLMLDEITYLVCSVLVTIIQRKF